MAVRLERMFGRLGELARSDVAPLAVGFLLAYAAFELIRAFVENLIMPLVFLVFGESEFPYLSFRIENTDFNYGGVIAYAIAFGVVLLLAIPIWRAYRRGDAHPDLRDCPECLTPIPAAAKRCPECTSALEPSQSRS